MGKTFKDRKYDKFSYDNQFQSSQKRKEKSKSWSREKTITPEDLLLKQNNKTQSTLYKKTNQ